MQVTYSLDTTTVRATETELSEHHDKIQDACNAERRSGRRVVVIKLEIHQATTTETEAHPHARVFPQPLQALGALLPVVVAERLKDFALKRGQPLSDLTRALWTEFLIARARRGGTDYWATFIEHRLDAIKAIRDRKGSVSYARTRSVQLHPRKGTQKKQSRRK